jgi:DNA-binding transcriptional LysR family regulator
MDASTTPPVTSQCAHSALTRRRYFLPGLVPQLIAFEACIRLGSVTAAARELHLAQPTVSCLVSKLAITFGSRLTLRRNARIEATERGEQVLRLSREMLDVLSRFDSREHPAPAEPADRLHAASH